ncbi:MAG: tetratricopeptide repeat protein [Gemmatimonadales bacterium]
MSIESLKQQARRHEQNEEWQKALDQYRKAIDELAEDEQTDIGLINRVGDLYVRVGNLDEAVSFFEQAVDLYREAFLPNNAIAVCKKIIRSAPHRHQVYLKIGQIRAEQGFLPDARTNFLTYAERMQKSGNLDESFRALIEFCDLAPDDVQVRITVADQMASHNRAKDAVKQLLIAYRQLAQTGEGDLAKGVEKKILALDPNADVGAALAAGAASSMSADGEIEAAFGEIAIASDAPGRARKKEEDVDFSMSTPGTFDLGDVPGVEEESEGEETADEAVEEEGLELPMMSLDTEASDEEQEEEEEGGFELPMMTFEEADAKEEEAAIELPMMSFDSPADAEESLEASAGEGEDEDVAAELPIMSFDSEPEPESADAESDLGVEAEAGLTDFAGAASQAMEEAVEEARPAKPAPAPASPAPEAPAAPGGSSEGYIDLGAMILGGGDPKSTRFKVAYEEPTGDEDADFAKMLSQFKEKVSENIDSGDVRAHYDLGTAYKEMGLLEEAIGAFQSALRASSAHLPTYELMGQTFIEMGEPEAAVKTLQRALQVKGVEDEFVGIYYYLARAYEALDKKESAVEFYDRVFSLDINFADVTERLRELR